MKSRDLKKACVILLEKSQRQSTISMGEILEILSGKGRLLILIFLSLPFCQPLQLPGLSMPFGLSVAFIGFRMAFSRRIWLPKRVLLKTIPAATVQKFSQKCLKLIKRIARWSHPRIRWLCKHRVSDIFNGLLIGLLGVFLAFPLPIPFTNLIAGWSIFLLSFGLLEEDGVFILGGYFFSFLTLVFFILLTFSFNHIF